MQTMTFLDDGREIWKVLDLLASWWARGIGNHVSELLFQFTQLVGVGQQVVGQSCESIC